MVQGKFEMEGNMKLAVNVDHIATIREARRHTIPEPVLAALLAEQAGAEGIVCHIRSLLSELSRTAFSTLIVIHRQEPFLRLKDYRKRFSIPHQKPGLEVVVKFKSL